MNKAFPTFWDYTLTCILSVTYSSRQSGVRVSIKAYKCCGRAEEQVSVADAGGRTGGESVGVGFQNGVDRQRWVVVFGERGLSFGL